ncbi:MAG: tRNA dihydrouridine synthase DusB [Proteobacteria bacterium]|nr:tRNA dihydrouridine synthase DusB [Pseudomonadota bacterium]
MMKPFKIENIEIAPNLVLAPMSGVTNIAFRRLIKKLNPNAVGLVVTEFISIEGITRGNDQSLRMMKFDEGERPISIQIFGHEIEKMVEAAKIAADKGADIVDINSGCPVPRVVKKGGGCELMRQPEHMKNLLEKVARAIKVPLTLKIRAGWDEKNKNALEIAKIAEGSGVKALAVHGRTRQEMYRGLADWNIVSEISKTISIPVIGSGDIVDYPSAQAALNSGASGLMIGRAALANPWVFSEIYSQIHSVPYTRPGYAATAEVLFEYLDLLLEDLTKRAAFGRLKQLTSQITKRVPGSQEVRKELCTSVSLDAYKERLMKWYEFLKTNEANGSSNYANDCSL